MSYFSFLRANPRFVSFGFGLNVFVALGQTFYVSLYNGEIRAALSLSHGELATLYGAATILGSICLLGTGRLLDRIDLRWFTGVTTIAVAIGCWMFASATTAVALFAAIFAVRFTAQSLWGMSAQVAMTRYFDVDRGKATAIAGTGFALGYAIFPLIGAWLLTTFGWRDAWTLTGWLVLLFILPLIMFQLWGHGERHRVYEANLEAAAHSSVETRVHQWTLSDVMADARFWLIQPAMVVLPSVIFSIQFHQLYLVETKGWDLTAFAGSYSLFSIASLSATLACGSLIDRFKSRPIVGLSLWPLIPALLALAFLDSPLTIAVLMILTGLALGLSLVVYVTIWAELYGTKHMGAIRSFNMFFNVAIASGVMALTGWLIDQGVGVPEMCLGGIVLVAVCLVCMEIAGRLPAKVPASATQV